MGGINCFTSSNKHNEAIIHQDNSGTSHATTKTTNKKSAQSQNSLENNIDSTCDKSQRKVRKVSLIPFWKPPQPHDYSQNKHTAGDQDKSSSKAKLDKLKKDKQHHRQSTTKTRIKFLKKNNLLYQNEVDSGAFSNIYKGLTLKDGFGDKQKLKAKSEVAIKRINLQAHSNKKFLSKFLEREILVHSLIGDTDKNHNPMNDHIVQYYGTLLEDPVDFYLIVEWLPRGNLLDYCRLRGRLKEYEAQVILCQIITGLHYMHENNIVHRDIKCENILVTTKTPLTDEELKKEQENKNKEKTNQKTEEEREEDANKLIIKVADFGFARFIGKDSFKNQVGKRTLVDTIKAIVNSNFELEHTELKVCSTPASVKSSLSTISRQMSNVANVKCRTFCGSLAYSPPELVMGHAYDGRKVDTWSTGCIAFILLTHRMPYKERYGNKVLIEQQAKDLRWPNYIGNSLTDDAKSFVEYMLAYSPDNRPFLVDVLLHTWLDRVRNKQFVKENVDEGKGKSLNRRGSVSAGCILAMQKV